VDGIGIFGGNFESIDKEFLIKENDFYFEQTPWYLIKSSLLN
jgi:hypothetical protein